MRDIASQAFVYGHLYDKIGGISVRGPPPRGGMIGLSRGPPPRGGISHRGPPIDSNVPPPRIGSSRPPPRMGIPRQKLMDVPKARPPRGRGIPPPRTGRPPPRSLLPRSRPPPRGSPPRRPLDSPSRGPPPSRGNVHHYLLFCK